MLLGLALLFFAPLILAFCVYYGTGGWHPRGSVNRGTLIDPALPLPRVSLPLVAPPVDPDGAPATAAAAAAGEPLTAPDFLLHKWTLLYVGAGDCGRACQRNLYDMRQVRTALNRDMSRVRRVFLAEGACCDRDFLRTQHPDLLTVRATAAAAPLIALLPGAAAAADGSGADAEAAGRSGDRAPAADGAGAERIYLIDPLGNLMMWYAPDANPKGMLEDLKRLLGLSHVG